jgi:NADH:ubiquinone oxidoreductase subunit D
MLCTAQELPELKAKLLQWLQFWQHNSNQGSSYLRLLLASAEVTLGVRTILQLLRRRLWTTQQQQQQQQHAMIQQQQQQQQALALQQAYDHLRRLGVVRTLYDLGQQTNEELLRDILQDSQVRDACAMCFKYTLQTCVGLHAAIIRQCVDNLPKGQH